MDNRPIGVFDSGIGGLTAVREIKTFMPDESIIYFGDTARVPYGSHSKETILQFAMQDMKFLLRRNVKAILVACGTVSSTSLEELKKMTTVPVFGVIEGASKKAVACSNNKKIGVLATSATVSSHAFKKAIESVDGNCIVAEKACPLFVPLIENGYANSENLVTKMVVSDYLSDTVLNGIDTVILGCTHYPVIKKAIHDYCPDVCIIEAGKEGALELRDYLEQNEMTAYEKYKSEYYVSEITESFCSSCEMFLGEDLINEIKRVDIESF